MASGKWETVTRYEALGSFAPGGSAVPRPPATAKAADRFERGEAAFEATRQFRELRDAGLAGVLDARASDLTMPLARIYVAGAYEAAKRKGLLKSSAARADDATFIQFDPLSVVRSDAAYDSAEGMSVAEAQRQANFANMQNAWKTPRRTAGRRDARRQTPLGPTFAGSDEETHVGGARAIAAASYAPQGHSRESTEHRAPKLLNGNSGDNSGAYGAGMEAGDDATADAQSAMFRRQKDAWKQPRRRDGRRGEPAKVDVNGAPR
jgi:hypothetical protein